MSTQTSSQSLPRSVLTESSINTVAGGEPSDAPYRPVSPLPFLVSSLYGQHEDLLRFLPGAFRRQGDVLSQGASFSVEEHTLKEIGRGMVDDLVHGDDLCARWPVIAIKRLRSKHHISWKTFETIERELITLKLMRGAPNIVQLVGLAWETAPVGDDLRLWPVLVLEYAECGSLAKLQDTVDPLSYEVKRKLCADVACGLLGLHNSGVLHGDVKSENVLIFGKLEDQYLAKLSDFGYVGIDYHLQQDLGCDEKIQRERSQVLPGATELWSAPEYGKPGTRRALMDQDVYSWGLLVLRTMVDGRNPFLMHQNWSEQQEMSSSILSIKKSSRTVRRTWIERCLTSGSPSNEVSQRLSTLTAVTDNCLCVDHESRDLKSALRAWQLEPSPEKRYPGRNVVEEIWSPMKFYSFRRLPIKVQNQFLKDFLLIQKLDPPLSPSNPLSKPFASAHMILAQAKLNKQRGSIGTPEFTEEVQSTVLHMITDCAKQGEPWATQLCTKGSTMNIKYDPSVGARPSGLEVNLQHEVKVVEARGDSLILVHSRLKEKLRRVEGLVSTNFGALVEELLLEAFHEACSLGSEDTARLLYDKHNCNEVFVNRADEFGETALLKACRAGSFGTALFLLESGAAPDKRPMSAMPSGQDTPLHWLCSFKEPELSQIARALVKAGARIDQQATAKSCLWDGLDSTELSFASGGPLHRAVSRRCRDAVACLLQLGASSHQPSDFGPRYTPLTLACSLHLHTTELAISKFPSSASLKSILELLLDQPGGYRPNNTYPSIGGERLPSFILTPTVLQRTALNGWKHESVVRATLDLLATRGEKFSDPSSGYSLLHLAVSAGDIDVVAYLLEKHQKRDANLTFKHGNAFWHPPLFYAVRNGHAEIFIHLLHSGADPFQRFQTDYILGGTGIPLERVFMAGEKMENFDRGRIRGPRSTYLHVCATSGSGGFFATKLLKQGLEINSYDSNWESPLFLAIAACNFELADYFIQEGASTEVLRDDRTMLGHLAEDGFLAPYAAFDYLLKAQMRHGPKGSVGFMAVHKEHRTWLHVLMDFWDTFRNPDWAETLLDLFARRLPDTRLLDIQIDMYVDIALHMVVESFNILGVRRLLHWGADPNVPNYEIGTPCDLVLKLVYDRMSKERITCETLKSDSFESPSMKATIEEVRKLEQIYELLKAHGGHGTRGTPPWQKKFSMSDIGEEGREFWRREQLGVDLKSIDIGPDGPCKEICNEIAKDINKTISGKHFTWEELSATATGIILHHLLRAPETAYTQRRLFRFEQHLGSLVGSFASLYLKFERELYGWRIELGRIPGGGGPPGSYVLSPPTKSDADLHLHLLKPEHQINPATRKADLRKLDEDASHSKPRLDSLPLISKWDPPVSTSKHERSLVDLSKSRISSRGASTREKLSPVGQVRLKQLMPPPGGNGVVIGRGDELADLLYPDNPLPVGTRVNIMTLSSGNYHFAVTIAAESQPARTGFPKSESQSNQLPNKIGRLFPQTEQKIFGASTGALKPQAFRLPSLPSSAFGLGQQSTSSGKTTELKTVKTYKSHRIDSDSSKDEDGDDMMALATRMLALEERRKEQIEARGLPPGCTHWWEARHLADE